MEGDGEGIVAIVQGLDTTGVTLTVCNRARHNSDRRRSCRPRIQMDAENTRRDMTAVDQRSQTLPTNVATVANERSSVETSTGTHFSRQHTSSQICDGRYASSYKLAHCMVTPTSPPEAVTEFPPQRKEPCRNQGNFEIGGHGSVHSSGKVRVSSTRVRHCGGSQTWGDKGSSHRYCKSNRDTEAFVHSLRKYPSMAPFRTASIDLIENLLRYTQAKNFQEMSRSSKSMRSLRQQKSSHTHEMAKASKYQQTYTRRQDDNVVNNSNVQVGYRGRVKNFKLYSPMSDSRNLKENRQRETSFSSSYDYLKAGNSPHERSNRTDESPSPAGSSSPERTRSPERSRSPDGFKSPEVSQSPGRFKSMDGFMNANGSRSPDRLNRPNRPLRFQRSVRDLSLSDMSKYIRGTIRQICNERPVVFQVCPKLKNRFNQHKKVCSNKNDRASDVMEDEPEEYQASGSVISRLIQSFSGCAIPSTEQAECQCTRTDCYCTKATQCINNPDASTNTTACSCKTTTKTGCCRGMSCVCANKSQDQAYYNKRIDEEISEWLKDVPVHSIECSDSKKKRDTVVKELRKTLKQLPDDENFDNIARIEIKSFVDDFPLWNPGKDKKDEKLFKNQLADKLTERILSVLRKPDRFRDIVKKWVLNMDFEDDGEDVDKETIIDKFVNKLKSVAVDRPLCDIKYTHTLRKEIIELLVELALKFDGDMVMLKKTANKLATEIVSIPRNVNLLGDTTDLTDEFEENVSDWICEHGLCGELKKDPKLIEGLARKLNKLKSQGIDDECVVEKMKEEIHQFVDYLGIAIATMDELIDELMKQLSNTVQINEMERQDQDELTEVFIDWLSNLPGASDLHPRKFEKIIKELGKVIIEGREQENENLANNILNYLVDADFSVNSFELGVHVEELMDKLNLLPSNKYHKEQIKKAMVKDIFDIIENMPISQGKKGKLRNKAIKIVENHLHRLSLTSKEAHDDVKEAIMEDMDDAFSSIDIPKETRLKLKNSLGNMINSNFDISCTRLRRLTRDRSNLKQNIANDVRNAVKELPINTDKKKDLMQQVKGTLSKNMYKPLPSNVKNTIHDEISDIVERCPISEDNSIVGSLKKMLSAVASKYLNICSPKCVSDIQNKVEKDVGIVIDKYSIDTGKKKELKKSIQDILTDNEDRHLSDEVLRIIKKDINDVVGDLSIPQNKKDVLKKAVGETISKDFNEALSNLRHDLNKIRNKLLEDICNIIEKSPIPRDVKTHLINKLKSMLARNFDTSLSDEEKYTILDDVSNIVKDDMPEEKRRSLTNKLAKKLDTQQRKEDTNEIDKLTKNLKKIENIKLEYILQEIEQAVEEAPIPKEKKTDLKQTLKDMATINYKKPAEDIAEALIDGVNEILDELNLPKGKKNDLKNELAAAIDEYSKLLSERKHVEKEYFQLKQRSSEHANGKHKQNLTGKGLIPFEEFDANKFKDFFLQGIEDIIEESATPEEKKMELKRKLKKMATDKLKKPFSDDMQNAIKIGIADILEELQIPKPVKNKLKHALINMTNDCLNNLREAKQPIEEIDQVKAQKSILQGIEKVIEESAIPAEKKIELKRELKKMATDNLNKPFTDDVQDAIKIGIADILDELQMPKPEKNKLKRALMNMTNDYLDNVGEEKQLIEEIDETKAKEGILQGIEKIIEESAIPEEKKMELKRKLKKVTADNLKKPLSDDVLDAVKIGIADILDKLQIPNSQKYKLERALTNMTDENVANLRDVDKIKAKAKNILQGIEQIIKDSVIPKEKKMELKRKLKEMATDNLKKPFSDDMQDAIKIDIADILEDLQIPKAEKDKLKRQLINMTNDYLDNVGEEKQLIEEIDETKAKEGILQGIEKIIEESAIPEEKKMELKRKLKKVTAANLKKPLSDDVLDAVKIGIADILDKLQIPKSQKYKLERALTNMTDENVANLRDVDKTKANAKNILQGIEQIIKDSVIPKEKKMELKRKLKEMATDNLKKPFSDDMQDAIKIGIADILEDLQIPKAEKDKLKRELINMSDDNFRKAKQPVKDVNETKAKENILHGIEKIVEESAIPEEKKMELNRKLKKMAADNLKKPLSENVQNSIKIDIADILDELEIPKSEKDKLKRALINMTDENVANLRDVDKTKAKESILQGIEKIIKESVIPEEKKMELKRKLKEMATDNLKTPFSDDVQDAMKIGIADILEELQIPKSEKDKLKRVLINMTDENVGNLRDDDKTKAKVSILQDIEKIIIGSAIPEEKKIELKRKLKKMATENLNKPFTGDVHDAIKIGIADILDELQIHKPEKNKLKHALINMTNDYLDNLGEEIDETKAKEGILQGIEKIIENSAIPEEKKMELKRKWKNVTADNLKKPSSDDVLDATKTGIADILDELEIPKSEKDKLERALINMNDENVANLRDIDKTKAEESILQGIEQLIEESAIPAETKMKLNRKLKKMASDNLKKPLSDDVQNAIKIGIAEILDELQIPKDEKNKFKRALLSMVDENVDNLQGVPPKLSTRVKDLKGLQSKTQKKMLLGFEEAIDEAPITIEKKKELKKKLTDLATKSFHKSLSDDVTESFEAGIYEIIDELNSPKDKTNKLKSDSKIKGTKTNMVDDSVENFRDTKQVKPLKGLMPIAEVDETNAKESILQGIENIIEELGIPEEKKMKTKRKLKEMAIDNLKNPFSDDMQDALKIGIADILDELEIPESGKDKLKRALLNMVDENVENLQETQQIRPLKGQRSEEEFDETKTREIIMEGIETIIEESAIPEEKKMKFKRKLKEMAGDNLKKPLSGDVLDAIKIGIAGILDELEIPKSEKDKLKRALINMAEENVDNLRDFDKTKAKESILQGIDKIIKESAIPEEKRMILKRKLKNIATDKLQKPFTDDVQDVLKIGIADIVNELQIPYSEKNKLKRALLNMVDENLDNLRGVPLKLSSQANFKELESETQNNILLGFEKAFDEAPLPIDKKKELKKKLKHMATENFQKSLCDDTAEALKDGINEILDELNLPEDRNNKLKSELTAVVDENLSNFKNEINLAKSMPDAKRNKLNIIIRRVMPQFDEAVDPSYQKQLAEEFDELLEIALMGGDFKDARRKLIKKLMREQNLSEKEASAPVDELIGRAREMALNEDIGDERNELDPSYVETLEADIDDLVSIALVGGHFEDARRKLTKKLMREQNLPEEEAVACANDLIAKAQKLALAAQSKDKTLLHKKALAKAISDAVGQSTMSKPDKRSVNNKLINKFKQTMDNTPFINKDDLEPIKREVVKKIKNIVDTSMIPTDKKNEFMSLLNKELAKTIDEIMDHYDDEEGYTKDYTKAISRAVNKSPIPNIEKSYLKKELAKTFDGVIDDYDEDKIAKHKEAFGKAINNAVDQSTLSKPDKISLKNKLLNKMEQTVDVSPQINDTGALKARVLIDCKNLVDASSIPIGKKNELKILLKEYIMDDYDDEETFAIEERPEHEDKISEYKEAFAKAINKAVNKSPVRDDYDESRMEDKLKKYKEAFAKAINDAVDQSTLSKPDKSSQKNKLLSKLNQTIDNSTHLNDIGSLISEVLKDSKKVVDVSSIPTDKKKELKLVLQEAMEEAFKELMNDEEVSREPFAMFRGKIAETVKAWMDSLPIDLDPKVATTVAKDIASDILDRQKYLQVHPEAVSTDKDEIENLKYQIFRRMKTVVDPKDIPTVMEGTEELYRMIMDIEPPPGFPKLRRSSLRGLVDLN